MLRNQFYDDLMPNLITHTSLFVLNLVLILIVVILILWAFDNKPRKK